jgi:hypothetical protein
MKRLALGALGVGLALAAAAAPGEAQAVRVGVGIRVPHVGVRFEHGPRRVYTVRRIPRYDYRGRVRALAYMTRYERELYREWLAFEYRRWLRYNRHLRYRSQRAWERDFLRDQRRAERAFRKWQRDRERELARMRNRRDDRDRERQIARWRDRRDDRDRGRPRPIDRRGNRSNRRGR